MRSSTHIALGLAVALAGSTALSGLQDAAAQEVRRLVVAMDPPSVDSTRFWTTPGDLGPDASVPRLVGNDPVTGEYDGSGLAESWEHNEDFTTWTFRLHPDAEWHFGFGPVTAEDVAHSYELHTVPEATGAGVDQLRGATTEIIDDHTIAFHFEEPRVGFLFVLAGRGAMYVYSKAQHDAEGDEGYETRPAGTGPYQFVEARVGEGWYFERVEDHWAGIEPDFDEIELRWTPEPATKLAMLLAGEAHIAHLPRELQADALDGGMEIVASQNPAMQVTVMLNGLYLKSGDEAARPDLPWADVRVREAMNRALNREELFEVLYDGRAEQLVRYGMDPRHEGFVQELVDRFDDEYGYDPERAKELLAEAGYPDAFPEPVIPLISTFVTGNPEFPVLAELLQIYFEEIGLQTEIQEMDWAALAALGRGRQSYVVHGIRNAPIRPTQVHLVNSYTSGGSVYHGFEDDTIQALIDELVPTIDPDERDRIAGEAFTYLYEQYSDLPLAALAAEVAVNPEVVAGWTFPGATSSGLSHWELVEAAR
jgi:peptide/nickel transport system substrate-binding protein